MSKIVGIGANVYDTLITVPFFPGEDTKLKADSVSASGGGPCATALAAAGKLGEKCAYIGNLSSDRFGKFLIEDMKKYGVSDEFVNVCSEGSSFTSFILLSENSASRTCIFDKGNLPELKLSGVQKNAVKNAEILMVDGNELDAAIEGAKIARANGTSVLYDAGGLYDGIDELLKLSDILIPSCEFAVSYTWENTAEDAVKKLFSMFNPKVVVVTCGKDGGIMYDGNELFRYPAFKVEAVDTNGAGDVFHGAFAFSLARGYNYKKCCIFSSAVSALKCTKIGARMSVPSFSGTIEFLKERGYDEF